MIRILNKNLQFIDFLRKYTFAQYQRCFRNVGTFQIDAMISEDNLFLLNRSEQFFVLFGYEDFGIIENIEKQNNDEYNNTITLSGRMALSILTKRIVLKTFKYTGISYAFVKGVITNNLISSEDSNRNMNITVNYINEDILKTRSRKINKSVTGGYVWDAVYDVLELDKLGIKLIPNVSVSENTNIESWDLDIMPGVDRTKGNKLGNEAVIFSQSLSNIKETEYLTDVQEYRNVAYIAGEGEGTSRKWYEKEINTSDSKGENGFLRSELWIDARDIQSEDEEGNIITDAEYEALIQNRVDEKAQENTIKDTYNATVIEENKLFKYGIDYNLGDFVTVIDDELGIEVVAQITEVIISEQDTGEIVDIVLSYGNPRYDFVKQIKQNKQKEEENSVGIKYLEQQIKKSSGGGGGDTPLPGTMEIDDLTVNFEVAEEIAQIVKADPVKTIFGKIAKWYNDFKTVAFTGKYNDLLDKPELFSGNYNDLINKPDIPTIPTYNGAVSTILNNNLESNMAVVSNDEGKISVLENVTKQDIEYLSGLTGNVQQQINNINLGSGSGGVYEYVGTLADMYENLATFEDGTTAYISDENNAIKKILDILVSNKLEENTWHIISIVAANHLGQRYWSLGDTKSFDFEYNGNTYSTTMQIADFEHDILSNTENDRANITFLSLNNFTDITASDAGGIASKSIVGSDAWNKMLDIWSNVPYSITSHVRSVKKKNQSYDSAVIVSDIDVDVFIPSLKEVGINPYPVDDYGERYPVFIKTYNDGYGSAGTNQSNITDGSRKRGAGYYPILSIGYSGDSAYYNIITSSNGALYRASSGNAIRLIIGFCM